MKLQTATLIAIIGLSFTILNSIGNALLMFRTSSYSFRWLVFPLILHGSLLCFFVVLYQRQSDEQEK